MQGLTVITWQRNELNGYEYYFANVRTNWSNPDSPEFCLGFIFISLTEPKSGRMEYFPASPYELLSNGCKSFFFAEDSTRSEMINFLQREFTSTHHKFVRQFFA